MGTPMALPATSQSAVSHAADCAEEYPGGRLSGVAVEHPRVEWLDIQGILPDEHGAQALCHRIGYAFARMRFPYARYAGVGFYFYIVPIFVALQCCGFNIGNFHGVPLLLA